MAITENIYSNVTTTGPFSFTFPYLEEADVKVSINGVATTAFTLDAGLSNITLDSAPSTASTLRIYRVTGIEDLTATFATGSAIRARDLNDNFDQTLYVVQEVANYAIQDTGDVPFQGDLDMNNYKILNVAEPTTDGGGVNKKYVDDRTGNVSIPGHTYWRYTATGGETVLSGTGDVGGTLQYSATREQVFLNGALQQRGVDYTANDGLVVTMTVALTAGDIVDIRCVNNLASGNTGWADDISYGNEFTGQVTRDVSSKLSDVVSVKDFGAVGDGARINQALAANGGVVFVPEDNYTLEVDVSPTTGGLFIDPGAVFDDQSKLKPRGAFSDAGNGVNAWRLQDRVFVGGGVSVAPTTTPALDGYDIAGDPSGLNSDYLERTAAVASSNAYGGGGGLFATRQSRQYTAQGYTVWSSGEVVTAGAKRAYYEKLYTATTSGTTGGTPPSHTSGAVSDGGVTWQFDQYTFMVPIGLAAVADADVSDGHSCWALYLEGLRRSTAGTLLTAEIAVKNKGTRVENNPYNILPSGATIGFWFAGGGDAVLGAPANPSTCAIAIGKNATTWDRGIVFSSDSLTNGEALSLAKDHAIHWYSPDQSLKGAILSTATNSHAGKAFIQFTDNGLWFSHGDALHCTLEGSTTDNSWLRLAGGTNSVSITAGSSAADAKLALSGKGAGTIRLDSALEFAYSGFNLAATPANFTADRYMVVYDSSGTPFYIPARLATW